MPRDGVETSRSVRSETETMEPERVYRCAACRAEVTKPCWGMDVDGERERAFFNPAGIVFRVLCFREAPGAIGFGEASSDFTWFRSYAWRLALCRSCCGHIGWRYEGAVDPPVFFGLIKDKLILSASGSAPESGG